MPETYAYLGAWNDWLNKPILDEGWFDEVEARARYESMREHFEVVPYAVFECQSQGPRPGTPWTVRFYSEGDTRFKSTFFDDYGSIYRVIWYALVDERLFKSEITEYTYDYNHDPGRRDEDECVLITNGLFRPDGTGTLRINNKSEPTIQQLSIDQIDVSAHWLDIPEFGHWDQLSNPSFGTPQT